MHITLPEYIAYNAQFVPVVCFIVVLSPLYSQSMLFIWTFIVARQTTLKDIDKIDLYDRPKLNRAVTVYKLF